MLKIPFNNVNRKITCKIMFTAACKAGKINLLANTTELSNIILIAICTSTESSQPKLYLFNNILHV